VPRAVDASDASLRFANIDLDRPPDAISMTVSPARSPVRRRTPRPSRQHGAAQSCSASVRSWISRVPPPGIRIATQAHRPLAPMQGVDEQAITSVPAPVIDVIAVAWMVPTRRARPRRHLPRTQGESSRWRLPYRHR
jgi:hypothetical protein